MIFCIHECEEIIGYSFKDKALLRTCFTHKSYSNEHKVESYEKLEYLGDAILDFVVAEYLFKNAKGDEGDLTQKRADIVSAKPLADAVVSMGLEQFVLLGEGEKKKGAKPNICADLFESVIAGIYLDGGMEQAKKFIMDKLLKSKVKREIDSKSKLQVYVQKHKLGSIEYVDVERKGPDHAPEFTVAVLLKGKEIARGVAGNKRNAQQEAAKTAYTKITTQQRRRGKQN